jgi:paraquat-inducible protein B
MSNEPSHYGDDLPKTKTRRRHWNFPYLWMVPVAAALVAGYLVLQRVREFGSTITIRFRDVSGVKPGQTPVRYRGADIGKVSSVALSKGRHYATVDWFARPDGNPPARCPIR